MHMTLAALPLAVLAAVATSSQERGDDVAERRARVAELAEQLSERRGLARERPVSVSVVAPDEYRAALRAQLLRHHPEGHFAHTLDVFRALGFVPAGFEGDLLDAALDALAGNMIGLYDPPTEAILLVDTSGMRLGAVLGSEAVQDELLVHEIQHALQDQRWALSGLIGRAAGSFDRRLARSALIEGDATLSAMDFMLARSGSSLDELEGDLGERVADSVRASSLTTAMAEGVVADVSVQAFTYGDGAGLVHRMFRDGGWERVAAAFDDPPDSCEQVLHPEKYLEERDWPVALEPALPEALASEGWSVLHRDTLGEVLVRAIVGAAGDEESAIRASIGWDGDQVVLFGREGERAVAWLSAWDSMSDAREAIRGLGAALGAEDPRRLDDGAFVDAGARPCFVQRDGRRVVVVAGLEGALAVECAERVLATEAVHDPRDEREGRGDSISTRRIQRAALEALAGEAVVVDGRRVTVRDIELSFELPSDDWARELNTPMPDTRVVYQRGGPEENFNVYVTAMPPVSMEELRDGSLELLRSIGEGLEVESATVGRYAGGQGIQLRYSMELRGRRMHFWQRIFANGDDQLVLTVTSQRGPIDDALEEDARAIFESVEIAGVGATGDGSGDR